jgi:hypothetical protein
MKNVYIEIKDEEKGIVTSYDTIMCKKAWIHYNFTLCIEKCVIGIEELRTLCPKLTFVQNKKLITVQVTSDMIVFIYP